MEIATAPDTASTTFVPDGSPSPVEKPIASLVLARGRLLAALKSVTPFVCHDETRFHLCSVLIEVQAGPVLRMVATDGHTLAMADIAMSTDSRNAGMVDDGTNLIKLESIEAAIKALAHKPADAGLPVVLAMHRKRWTLTIDAATITLDLVDSKFPPYPQVIPARARELRRARRPDAPSSVRVRDTWRVPARRSRHSSAVAKRKRTCAASARWSPCSRVARRSSTVAARSIRSGSTTRIPSPANS